MVNDNRRTKQNAVMFKTVSLEHMSLCGHCGHPVGPTVKQIYVNGVLLEGYFCNHDTNCAREYVDKFVIDRDFRKREDRKGDHTPKIPNYDLDVPPGTEKYLSRTRHSKLQ